MGAGPKKEDGGLRRAVFWTAGAGRHLDLGRGGAPYGLLLLVTLWGKGWRVPAGIIIDVLVLSSLNWPRKSGRSFSHPLPSPANAVPSLPSPPICARRTPSDSSSLLHRRPSSTHLPHRALRFPIHQVSLPETTFPPQITRFHRAFSRPSCVRGWNPVSPINNAHHFAVSSSFRRNPHFFFREANTGHPVNVPGCMRNV